VLVAAFSYAATIKGKVKDASDQEPLIGVTVNIKNTNKVASTDENGEYVIENVADGKYELVFSYITYTELVKTVTVAGKDVILDVSMASDKKQLKEVTVSRFRVTNTENALMLEMRKSNSIASGIAAAQISKTMDRNAADVVKRIPGVTVQDDRFIVVRGLADRYNSTWMNDAAAPSSEIDKKAFSFDMVPSGLIDRIIVNKTPSPELPGDFAGGMVKLYTASIPDKDHISVGFQTSTRQNSTGTVSNYEKPSKTDWLGYDDGMRDVPKGVPVTDSVNSLSDTGKYKMSKLFPNSWVLQQKKTMPDFRFNLSAGKVLKVGRMKIGNVFGLSYSNTSTNFVYDRQSWDDTAMEYHFSDLESSNQARVGLLNNTAVVVGNSKFEFKNLYNQMGRSSVIIRNTVRDVNLPTAPDERSYMIGYESRATYTAQLSGTHKNSEETRKYNWTLGYTDVFRNQPDLRRIRYTKQQLDDDSMYKAPIAGNVDPIYGGGRFYAKLFENLYSFNHAYSQKVKIRNYSFEASAGNFIEFKKRDFRARSFGYTIRTIGNPLSKTLTLKPLNEIFADSNVGEAKKFLIGENINKSDVYSAENQLIASYLALKLPLGEVVTVSGGMRYEHNTQTLKTVVGSDSISPSVVTKYWLPSVNISYNINERQLVRVAYGKTLNRPEFREWAPFFFFDFLDRGGIYGSLVFDKLLNVAEINNFDARWEWYPSESEMVHAGLFHKTFKNPIQRIILPGGSESRNFTFINADKAQATGVELEVRKNLHELDDALNIHFFENLMLVGNATFIKSEMTYYDSTILNTVKTNMQGQSPYMFNWGLFYQNDSLPLQSSLLYNVTGPNIYLLGGLNNVPSIGQMPFHSLDFTVSKSFFKHYIIDFGIQNLLNSDMVLLQDRDLNGKFDNKNDKIFRSFKPGRYYSIGVKIKF
jgi:outer membrane receptor protein involved in Fe transport